MTKQRVLVTGAIGHLGRWVVRELVSAGREVIALDRRAPSEDVREQWLAGADVRRFSLNDTARLDAALEGCTGLVHLAAFNSPLGRAPEDVFRHNTGATATVLEAAARSAVTTAVVASSTSVVGLTYAPEPFSPVYVPVDEEHPVTPKDAYALSKWVDEQTAAMIHRRTGMTVLALRFHWVAPPDAALERALRVAADPAIGSRELWGYVDARDAGRACRLALDRRELGFQVMNIAATDSLASIPSASLVRRFHPTTVVRRSMRGTESIWSIELARRLLDYEPAFSWRLAQAA